MEALMGGFQFWYWWAFGGVLVIIEAFAPGFMFLWLGIAAGLVGLVLVVWPELGQGAQLLLYAALSVLCVSGWTWYQRHHPKTTDHPHLNRRGAHYVGRCFSLVAPIVNGRGRIKLGDSSWTVAGPDLPAGRIVEVTGIEGAVLTVRPAPEGAPVGTVGDDVQATHA
jgi:membrane protein implicated in regulation of membrane protease activity